MSEALNPSMLFLTRENCGLCDQAWAILQQCDLHRHYEPVDIDTNLNLIRQFGDKVPVLADADLTHCLFWPFDQQAVLDYWEQVTG